MTVHTENEALFQRASRCLAGGVLSNFKKAKGVAPVYVKSAEGCRMTDYDGNVYYDFSLSAGPAILGHSNEGLRRALREQLDQAYTNRDCLAAIEAAEKIQQVVPCAELVRFAVSGVDAVFNAIRVARAYTGRPLYVKFKGQYNGGMDFVLGGRTDRGDLQARDGVDPDDFYSAMCYTEGRAPHALDDCLLAEYNDLEGLAALFQEQGDQIACVIMEPVTLNMTGCMPEPGFLEGLRELCTRYGVLMVFDETLTGFRLALGGAQEYFGVTPDLCTFAKAIGGGFPVAAFAGRREVMQVIEDNRVLAVGTYNGHPLAAAAVLETIRQLEANDGEAFRLIRPVHPDGQGWHGGSGQKARRGHDRPGDAGGALSCVHQEGEDHQPPGRPGQRQLPQAQPLYGPAEGPRHPAQQPPLLLPRPHRGGHPVPPLRRG